MIRELNLKQSLPPAHSVQLFLETKAANGRPDQLLLPSWLRLQGVLDLFLEQDALTGVFLDCLKLIPELDRDVSLLASCPNVIVLDVFQVLSNEVTVLANAGHEDRVEDTVYVSGRHKRHRRDHMLKLGQHKVILLARLI